MRAVEGWHVGVISRGSSVGTLGLSQEVQVCGYLKSQRYLVEVISRGSTLGLSQEVQVSCAVVQLEVGITIWGWRLLAFAGPEVRVCFRI